MIIAGGGTGGHLYPGLALAQEFERRGKAEILFIGTAYGIESKVLPKTHYRFKKIWMRGLQRKLALENLIFPVRLLVSLFQCAAAMIAFRPQVVIGTGGYVSGPALMAALLLRVPSVIQEQNSYPGLVNRLLGKWVNQVHLTYADSLPYFKNSFTYVSGNPVRGEFSATLRDSRARAAQKFKLDESKTTLFVFGGSQGARAINERLLNCLSRLLEVSTLQILWATGAGEYDMIAGKSDINNQALRIQPFIDDMASAYAITDLALCRAGASTLSEIATCGIPAILVPYPYAAAGHQDFNARTMAKAGAAIVIHERDFTEEALINNVRDLVGNQEKRTMMAAAARRLGRPDAAREIVDKILELIDHN